MAAGAKWRPDALAVTIGDALEVGALSGREAVFAEEDADFAAADVFSQPFREQIDFLRQKRVKPTKAWTDAMRGVHDRAFVIAGATDTAMLSDFQQAIADHAENGGTIKDFEKDFDRLVSKYGWTYKGKRGWRIRVIFETNIRTSYQAGRLKQMRDPDVLKLRPYWEYRHGETRTPKVPRPAHLRWNGRILLHSDPWWKTHFPPNDWLCSCGVRTLSLADLKRMGRDGPDPSPGELLEPFIDPVTGQLSEKPQGVGYGWDYMPGDLWEQGLTPQALINEGEPMLGNPRMAVEVDTPEPMADLVAKAKPIKSRPLKDGLDPEDYVRGFLKPFGAEIGQAVLFEDKAGVKIPISDQLFRDRRGGDWKVMKGDRATVTPLLAEALMDPDEIWQGVAVKRDPVNPDLQELLVDRRYIRVDAKTGLVIVFEIGERFWEAITAYNATTKTGKLDLKTLDRRRGGKLLYKRKK